MVYVLLSVFICRVCLFGGFRRRSEVCPVQTSVDLFSSLTNADEAHIFPVSGFSFYSPFSFSFKSHFTPKLNKNIAASSSSRGSSVLRPFNDWSNYVLVIAIFRFFFLL